MITDSIPKFRKAQQLYRALAAADREALSMLLHPDFVGQVTDGLPLDMGGRHEGPEAMRRDVWWTIGRHYQVEVQPDEFRLLDDGRLFVAGHYRGRAAPPAAAWMRRSSISSLSPTDGLITSLQQLTDSAAWVRALGEGAARQTIDYSVTDALATVCLNRPAVRNAINMRMVEEIPRCRTSDRGRRLDPRRAHLRQRACADRRWGH